MKCLALLDGPFVVGTKGRVGRGKNAGHHERRPSPDPSRWPSTTRRRRRRGTSSASSSGRSTARRRRPRTAGCTARATRYVFSASFAVARAAVLRRASTRRPDPAARWPAPELTAEPTSGPRREKDPPQTPSTRPATKNAGETRRQGEAGPRARAEVQGGRREGVRQARAERRAARGRVGGHDGVRGPCPFLGHFGSTTRDIPQDAIAATRHRRRWARAEGGGAAAPLAVVAELASPPAGEDEYGHEVVDVANGAAAAAFLAAGHGVIDVAAMLGLRVDAHPGSTAGGTDGLHFCMPGPLDYALDLVLARVGSAFDSVVPEIDAPH
ncbi:unnamed protein product [Pelagomonas calceolata]|uniref:Uncharacterized protein n=1 Tax=Pelagomonas calceolata TaxID=35677 RepID=A0A8J2WTI1_9STRA|nr:unnamed protein product [Pelagomonas calceolata]